MPSLSKSSKAGNPRPSEVASDNKRHYIYGVQQWMHQNSRNPGSMLFPDSEDIMQDDTPRDVSTAWLSVAVVEGDPVDVALRWQEEVAPDVHQSNAPNRIAVVNMANDRKPGGDWESGTLGPEECFARRSNLAQQLKADWNRYEPTGNHYPIPATGGVYTLNTVVFRDGPDDYAVWPEWKCLPVISVAPVRRPKLDTAGKRYAFEQERELMREKMRTILRIAGQWKHWNLCLGAFGTGPNLKNPPAEVAEMWKELLFEDPEFKGLFKTVIFAIDPKQAASSKTHKAEMDIFSEVFDPYKLFYAKARH